MPFLASRFIHVDSRTLVAHDPSRTIRRHARQSACGADVGLASLSNPTLSGRDRSATDGCSRVGGHGGWRGPAHGPGQRDAVEAAEAERVGPAMDDKPLHPAAGTGWLDVQVQSVAVTVPPGLADGAAEGGRQRLVGMGAPWAWISADRRRSYYIPCTIRSWNREAICGRGRTHRRRRSQNTSILQRILSCPMEDVAELDWRD